MLRPSISTSCEFAKVPVDCRLVTWTSRAESWMTLTPGTERRTSPTFELAVVSRVAAGTTDVVTGALTTRTSVREAVTTTVSPKLAMGSMRGGTSTSPSATAIPSRVASENPDSSAVTLPRGGVDSAVAPTAGLPPTTGLDVVSDSDSACAIIGSPRQSTVAPEPPSGIRHSLATRMHARLDAAMTRSQKTPLPTGLPRRFSDGQPGFQRLHQFLGIRNTRAVDAVLEREAVKNAIPPVPRTLPRAERRRMGLTAYYGNPESRRERWRQALGIGPRPPAANRRQPPAVTRVHRSAAP